MLKAFIIALLAAFSAMAQTAVTIGVPTGTGAPGVLIASDFIGLSFEAGVPYLASDTELNLNNTGYQNMAGLLAPLSLRFAGDTVNSLKWYEGTCGTDHSAHPNSLCEDDVAAAVAFSRAVNGANATKLLMFGINIDTGGNGNNMTEAMANAESAYIVSTAGSMVYGFELANEPDSGNETWGTNLGGTGGYESYFNAFYPGVNNGGINPVFGISAMKAAIETWTKPFVGSYGSDLAMITQHRYGLGSTDTISVTSLLSPTTVAAEMSDDAEVLTIATGANGGKGLDWRMDETNATYNGAAGVNDAYASALWVTDYMYLVATSGARGVNVYGDGTTGGFSVIVPLVGCPTATARPLFYGMLLFNQGMNKGVDMVPLNLTNNGLNLTSYGTVGHDGALRITVINKDPSTSAALTITPGTASTDYTSGTVMTMTNANGLSDTSGNTYLGGAQVTESGGWSGTSTAMTGQPNGSGAYTYTLAPAAAALFTFTGTPPSATTTTPSYGSTTATLNGTATPGVSGGSTSALTA